LGIAAVVGGHAARLPQFRDYRAPRGAPVNVGRRRIHDEYGAASGVVARDHPTDWHGHDDSEIGLVLPWATAQEANRSDRGSHLPLDHHASDLGDGLGRVEALGAGFGAIHDCVAAVEPERILEIVEAVAGRLVAAVFEPAVGLQQRGWSEEALAVPPI